MLTYHSPFPFEIMKTKNKTNAFSDNHYHPYYELIYVKKGSFSYFIDDKVYQISNQNIVLVPKDVIHKATFNTESESTYYTVHFFENFLDVSVLPLLQKLFLHRQIVLNEEKAYDVAQHLHSMEHEYLQRTDYCEVSIKNILSELVVLLLRAVAVQHTENKLSPIEASANYINECIANHNSGELTLEKVAGHFYMSPSYFSKKFKKELDIGFKEYVLSAKIIYSKKLIESTDLPITQIAFLSGFDDSNYFSTAFKRMEQISPREYAHILKNR